ncbi:hypothetical protein [Nonomuraea sp. NPDC003214]
MTDHPPQEPVDMAACVIGECARFGARLRTLTGQLEFAPAPATDREELQQAVAYIHAALADLLAALQPIHHEDLRRILSDREMGLVRCLDGCTPPRDATGAEVGACGGCGGGACRSCGHPVPPDGPALCWRCVASPEQPDPLRPGAVRTDPVRTGSVQTEGAPPGNTPGTAPETARPEAARLHIPAGDLPWVATA